jgi:NADPH:quinone reductase-like Zn-dependent oxidoreductase
VLIWPARSKRLAERNGIDRAMRYSARGRRLCRYVCARADRAVSKTGQHHEQAASVPIAAITALQGLRDKDTFSRGRRFWLMASGGVGTFAVQIAKSFGADVTGVCSTRNLDLVRSLGANHVIDTRKRFHEE